MESWFGQKPLVGNFIESFLEFQVYEVFLNALIHMIVDPFKEL